MHKNDRTVGLAFDVERAGGDGDVGQRIAVDLEEGQVFGQRRLAAVGPEIGDTGYQRGNCGVARGQPVVETDSWMNFLETFLPQLEDAAQTESEVPDRARDGLFGLVLGQIDESDVRRNALRVRQRRQERRANQRKRKPPDRSVTFKSPRTFMHAKS